MAATLLRVRLATHGMAIAQTLLWASLYYSFPAMLLTWHQQLSWSIADVSLAFTLALVASALCSPFIGRLIDKGFGPQVLSLSALLGGLALLAVSQVEHLWQFYGAWLLLGCTSAGCLYEPCFAFLTRYRGSDAKSAITKVTLYAGFAGTVSFPLCHYLVGLVGWRATSVGLALIVIFIATPLLFSCAKLIQGAKKPVSPQAKTRLASTPSKGVSHSLKSAMFWFIAIAFSLSALNHTVLVSFLLPSMHVINFSPNDAVLVMAMIGPMQVVGRIAMMSVDNRLSNTVITMLCFGSLLVAASLLWQLNNSHQLIWLFVVLQGSAYGVTSILRPVLTKQLLGEESFGAISGLLAVPYLLASASAPFLGAYAWQVNQQQGIFSLVSLSAVLGFVAMAACCLQQAAKTTNYQKLTAKPK
ncbi:MFS transporter [Agarivorans aestuarii]|uniref:MFS transporter n=1 Tax=Agarivorans aestuarii TaxID=1563703 RepID=A0ABU7G6J3_9ALTE|nr:MFS transporter [Agarivorans aestuarii]MEE1674784.1 MFS transporter [Agarivorans aestuarii]